MCTCHIKIYYNVTIVVPEDYEAVTSSVIQFDVGDIRVTHTIRIIQDQICETDPNEVFFSNIAFNSGVQPIIMIRQTAEIIIDDSAEPECSEISKHNTYVHSFSMSYCYVNISTMLFCVRMNVMKSHILHSCIFCSAPNRSN